ncbi:MAG: DUF2232 domain-containing protein [Gemmatimonadales bacterium]
MLAPPATAEYRHQAGAPGCPASLHQRVHRLTTTGAAPTTGRRSQALNFLLTAIFLIVAVPVFPVFFLGPLALLLLASRPRTLREWCWIAVCLGALAAWFHLPDSLSERTVRAAAVLFVGGFVALTAAGIRSLFVRAMVATALAGVAVTAWFAVYHLSFAAVQTEIVNQAWDASHQIWTSLPATPPASSSDLMVQPAPADFASKMGLAVAMMATLAPALLALVALLGAWLASTWYGRIARTPITPPPPPPPLAEFRFNDHLVWLLLLFVGAALAHTSDSVHLVTQNVLVVVLAMYWLRGLAVIRTALWRASPFVIGVLVLIMFPMLAFVLVGLTLLGVADTWLDFRRRMAPSTGVPT